MAIKSLGYIGITSNQSDAWRNFACNVMGLQDVSDQQPAANGDLYFKMDDHPWRIIVQPGDVEGVNFCGWETNNEAGLNEVALTLKNAGYDFSWGTETDIASRGVQNLLRFTDPAGNKHEVYWGVVSDFRRLNSPVGLPGFITGDQGMGHIVLPAVNFDETVSFFRDTLGFGLSDLMNIRFTPDPQEPVKRLWFMHCNARHHSLGLFEMDHPAGCIHLMTEVLDIDEVGRGNDRRLAHNIPLSGTLGRHANDHMVSFYMKTPSGFDVEYGAEGRTVSDWSSYEVFESTVPSFWGHDFSVGQID